MPQWLEEVGDCCDYVNYAWDDLLPDDFYLRLCEELIDKKNYEFCGIEVDRKILQEFRKRKEILAFLPEPTKVYYSDDDFCFQDAFWVLLFGKLFKLISCLENGITHACQDF